MKFIIFVTPFLKDHIENSTVFLTYNLSFLDKLKVELYELT